MLVLHIQKMEFWDETKEEFYVLKPFDIHLEHSLVSISKWESKHKKAFLSNREKTTEETLDYIRCMTIDQNVPDMVYKALRNSDIEKVNAYLSDSMSATHVPKESPSGGPKDAMTSEVIYYWMIAYNIPFECQKWHLNRLLTLIDVCHVKNAPAKKKNGRDICKRNKALNDARRKQLGTRG